MLKLFDMLVRPILLYGSKIWGEKTNEQIESVQRRFCRYVLGLPLTATNAAKLGESGRYPISLFVQLHSSHDILAQTALHCYPNHPPKSTQTVNIHAQLRTHVLVHRNHVWMEYVIPSTLWGRAMYILCPFYSQNLQNGSKIATQYSS